MACARSLVRDGKLQADTRCYRKLLFKQHLVNHPTVVTDCHGVGSCPMAVPGASSVLLSGCYCSEPDSNKSFSGLKSETTPGIPPFSRTSVQHRVGRRVRSTTSIVGYVMMCGVATIASAVKQSHRASIWRDYLAAYRLLTMALYGILAQPWPRSSLLDRAATVAIL